MWSRGVRELDVGLNKILYAGHEGKVELQLLQGM